MSIKDAVAVLLLAFALPAVGEAQDTVVVGRRGLDADSRVAREAVRFFNARTTARIFGRLEIPERDVLNGDIAVLDGPVRIRGEVRGDVVTINADVLLTAAAVIRGDLLVLGGDLRGADLARVTGSIRHYRSGALLRRRGETIELLRARRPTTYRTRSYRYRRTETDVDLVLRLPTYNRVEGLPIHLGPRVTWGKNSPVTFEIEALGIGRTAGDFDSNREDLGYVARGQLTAGRREGIALGVRVYDQVAAIEDWQLRGDEIGLASFLWHRDYRDYFMQRGVAGYLRISPHENLSLTGELARNDEESVSERDPWTLFRGDDMWRRNPAIDDGTFTSITVRAEWAGRRQRRYRTSGWHFMAEWERGISDDVQARFLPGIRGPLPADDYTFDRLFVDLRRYERIGWGGLLSLRAVGAGTLGSDPLPLQRRLSLGGPDPMPGFPFRIFRELACNTGLSDPALPALCDRIALFQVEYRGSLDIEPEFWDWGRRNGPGTGYSVEFLDFDDWFWFEGPSIVLFGDAGVGWIHGQDIPEIEADAGAGLEFGSVGAYAAKALTDGESLRFILRIHRRF